MGKIVKEKCGACSGKGINQEIDGKESACMNCTGRGFLEYEGMRKLKPATFEVYYNGEDFVIMIKPMSLTHHEPMYHVIMETAYSDSSYELLSAYEIKNKYGLKL